MFDALTHRLLRDAIVTVYPTRPVMALNAAAFRAFCGCLPQIPIETLRVRMEFEAACQVLGLWPVVNQPIGHALYVNRFGGATISVSHPAVGLAHPSLKRRFLVAPLEDGLWCEPEPPRIAQAVSR